MKIPTMSSLQLCAEEYIPGPALNMKMFARLFSTCLEAYEEQKRGEGSGCWEERSKTGVTTYLHFALIRVLDVNLKSFR